MRFAHAAPLMFFLGLAAGCAPPAGADATGESGGALTPIDSTKDGSRAMSLTAHAPTDAFSYTCLAGPTHCQIDLTALYADADIQTKMLSAPLQADPDWAGGKVRRSLSISINGETFADARSFGWHTPPADEGDRAPWYQDGLTSALMEPGVYTITISRDDQLPAGMLDPLRFGVQVKSKQEWCTEVKCYDSPDGDFAKRSMVTGTVAFQVTDSNGQVSSVPAANTVVQLDSYISSIGTTMTDDQGQFVFNSLALGQYKLSLPEFGEKTTIDVTTSPRQQLAPLIF